MKKRSYIRKLFFLLGAIITAAVLMIGTAIFYYAKSEIENELFFLNKRSLKQIGQGTNIRLAEYSHLSSKIASDSRIIELLKQGGGWDREAVARAAQTILDNYVWTYSDYNPLVYTYVLSGDGSVYASSYSQNEELEPILDQIDFEELERQPEGCLYQGAVENEQAKGVYRYTFLMVRMIRDHITGEACGYVVLNISEKNLYETYRDLIDKGKNFYITDKNGMIVSEKNKQRIGEFCGVDLQALDKEDKREETVVTDAGGKEAYFLYYEIPQTGWYLVETIETSSLLESFGKIRWFITAAISLVAVLLLLILKRFLKAISEPVMSIKEKMEEVSEGNMQVRLEYHKDNEFGEMARAFNYMVNKLAESMNAVKEEEKKKRLAEQEFLRAQINPHFIYNTLSSIRFFVEMNKNAEAEDMLYHFSKILRKSLSNPAEFVTLRAELETIEDYVELQKKRYKDGFIVEYDVPEEILDNQVPVFILQPIVENAIFHGMIQGQMGRILISGYEKEDKLYLRISDNGRGMKSEQIGQLYYKAGHMSKVGIHNVHDRIQLNFGEEYGLKVESTEGEGTTVIFILPVNKEEQNAECIDSR